MRHIMTIAAAASLLAAPAFAQNPPAKSGPGNAAVNTQKGNDAAPVEGANSFTEGQAKSKLEFEWLHQRVGAEEGRCRHLARKG